MGHRLVLELLEPFMKLHMVLVRTSVVVLSAAGLAPVGLGELERAGDLAVEDAVPLGRLTVELDGEDAGLDAQLEHGASFVVRGAEDAFLALVAACGAAGDVAKFRPWQVVGEHGW